VIGSLLAMRLPPRAAGAAAGGRAGFAAELREGVRYAAGSPPGRAALLLVAALSLLGMPCAVLMPDLAARALPPPPTSRSGARWWGSGG
jgi:hypothetical protein